MGYIYIYRIMYIFACCVLFINYGDAEQPLMFTLIMFILAMGYDYWALLIDAKGIEDVKLKGVQSGISFMAIISCFFLFLLVIVGSQISDLIMIGNVVYVESVSTFLFSFRFELYKVLLLWGIFPCLTFGELYCGVKRSKLSFV